MSTELSVTSTFKPTVSGEANKFVKLLVYGGVGVGKTLFSATGHGTTFYLDLDDGLLTVRRLKPQLAQDLNIDTSKIFSQRIRKYDELIQVLDKLHRVRTYPDFFTNIVFDNITVAQVFCMSQRIGIKEAISIERLPERTDWNLVLQQMRAIVTFVRDLPANVIFIAHEQEKNNMIGPMIQGAAYKQIPGLVDLMARYSIFNKEVDDGKGGKTNREVRALNFKGAPAIPGIQMGIEAKNRGGWMEPYEAPDFKKIVDKIYPSESDKKG